MVPHYCTVDAITVDFGDHGREFVRGQRLDDVPEATLEAMLRLGQASAEQPVDLWADEHEVEPQADWADVPVSTLKLPNKAKSALKAAGLSTVREVLDYGAETGSLLGVPGITEDLEKSIQEAIAAIHAD